MPKQTSIPTQAEVDAIVRRFMEVVARVGARVAAGEQTAPIAEEVQVQFDTGIVLLRKAGPSKLLAEVTLAETLGLGQVAGAGSLMGVLCGFLESGGRVVFLDPPEKKS